MPDPVNDAFAASLTRLRTEQGLTKQALAARSGVDQTTIGKIEAGVVGTTLRTAWALAEALGTTVAEMLAPARPARELAESMRETRQLRELVREICDELVSRNYPAAKVAPWLKRAGMPT